MDLYQTCNEELGNIKGVGGGQRPKGGKEAEGKGGQVYWRQEVKGREGGQGKGRRLVGGGKGGMRSGVGEEKEVRESLRGQGEGG